MKICNSSTCCAIDLIISESYVSLPNIFNRIPINSSTSIDCIWLNKIVYYNYGVFGIYISDHMPWFFMFTVAPMNNKRSEMYTFGDHSDDN